MERTPVTFIEKVLHQFRRQYVVDRQSQYTIIIYVISVAGLSTAFTSGTSWLWQIMLGPGYSLSDVPLSISLFLVLLVMLGAGMLLAFVIFGANYISNRLVGPVWRLQMHMKRVVSENDLTPINFRDKDQFPELAETYNQLLEKIRKLEELSQSKRT